MHMLKGTGGQAAVTVLGRGKFRAKLTKIELHRLWMQRSFDNLPRVARSANMAGRAIVSFRIRPGAMLLADGLEIPSAGAVRHSDPDNYYQISSGYASFGAMSLTVPDMVSVGAVRDALDLTPPKDVMIFIPRPYAMAKLQRLFVAATDLAEQAPEIIANSGAARGLEQALIEAMVDCLAFRLRRERSLAQGHPIVMRRFRRLVEENLEQPPYPEIYAGFEPHVAVVLPGTLGNGAKALPDAAAHASGAASAARSRA